MKIHQGIILAIALSLTACQTIYERPGGTREEFAQDKYQCIRETMPQGSVAAYGSPGFVVGSLATVELAAGITASMGYRNCMEAHGWFPQASHGS